MSCLKDFAEERNITVLVSDYGDVGLIIFLMPRVVEELNNQTEVFVFALKKKLIYLLFLVVFSDFLLFQKSPQSFLLLILGKNFGIFAWRNIFSNKR